MCVYIYIYIERERDIYIYIIYIYIYIYIYVYYVYIYIYIERERDICPRKRCTPCGGEVLHVCLPERSLGNTNWKTTLKRPLKMTGQSQHTLNMPLKCQNALNMPLNNPLGKDKF